MGRRKRDTRRKRRSRSVPGEPNAKQSDRSTFSRAENSRAENSRAETLAKMALRRIRQGRHADALASVEALFPVTSAEIPPERLRWLLQHWPEQALEELSSRGAFAPALEAVVADMALAISDGVVDLLDEYGCLTQSFAQDLRALRRASALVSAGEDVPARAELQRIGLRSPCRDGRLFLQALVGGYGGDTSAIARAARLLPAGGAYARLLRAWLDLLDPSVDEEPALARNLAKGLGITRASAVLQSVGALLAAGRPSAALGAAAQCRPLMSDGLRDALRRDLPAGLLAAGVRSESIPARVERVLSRDPEDPLQLRMRALLAEAEGCTHDAKLLWTEYADQLAAGVSGFTGRDRDLAEAAVRRRLGTLIRRMEGEAQDSPMAWLVPQLHHEMTRELLGRACDAFEAAVALDPERPDAWKDLVAASAARGDKAEAARVMERFVKAFPEEPEALLAAARAAGEREAWDKARRYARRAAELEPLNRAARDLEAWTLLGKARKLARGKAAIKVRAAYLALARFEGWTPDRRLECLAEVAAFHHLDGKATTAAGVQRRALATDRRPWLWEAHRILAWVRLSRARAAARSRTRRTVGTVPWEWSPPSQPPEAAELMAVGELVCAAEQERGRSAGLPRRLDRVVDQAVLAGCATVTAESQIADLLEHTRTFEAKLAVAEHGQRLFPDNPRFTLARYAVAVSLRKPAAYFSAAIRELERLRAAVEAADPFGPDDDASGLGPRFGDPTEAHARLTYAMTQVEQYLASLSSFRGPKQPTRFSFWR